MRRLGKKKTVKLRKETGLDILTARSAGDRYHSKFLFLRDNSVLILRKDGSLREITPPNNDHHYTNVFGF